MKLKLRIRGVTPRARRGIALFVTMFFVAGIGALALSAIYLTANATVLSKTYDKEDDLKYVAEAALQIGKAEVNFNPAALPNSSYVTLMHGEKLQTADGSTVPGLKVNLYLGPSGSTSGQFGRFASVVAEARDVNGTGFVRRLELSQESFAKFAYWTDIENQPSGAAIVFASGDALWGPVWSNDTITIGTGGATFHDDVGTAMPVIKNASAATFVKGYQVKLKRIELPSLASLANLSGLATVSGFNFPSTSTGTTTALKSRIEFIAVDLNGNGDSTETNEGFFRVYNATKSGSFSNPSQPEWLRADWPSSPTTSNLKNCGDWHKIGGKDQFFPVTVHTQTWFKDTLVANGQPTTDASSSVTVKTIMQHSGARCYLGGDPHLIASATGAKRGGDETTFYDSDTYGTWVKYTDTPDPIIAAARPLDAKYLFPLHRSFNLNTKGVIYSAGQIGISGVLRGVITLYSPKAIVILDDLRYANDPAKGVCIDIMGTISGDSTMVADNAINTPQQLPSASGYYSLDDTPGLFLHDIVMALGQTFQVEDYDEGPTSGLMCQTSNVGRGCLYVTGGLIQKRRGPVGVSDGHGYVKRYSYDRCAIVNPPPYFPTTGRFIDNRYYELDPNRVNDTTIAKYYKTLTPGS